MREKNTCRGKDFGNAIGSRLGEGIWDSGQRTHLGGPATLGLKVNKTTHKETSQKGIGGGGGGPTTGGGLAEADQQKAALDLKNTRKP